MGVTITLIGEDDNVTYGLLEVQSVYTVDQEEEARRVFMTDGSKHLGVKSYWDDLQHMWKDHFKS
ncbi:hypothetical protein [Paenibacillus sp. ACRRY]|uniref:hypothetical protein n=1 Tax=Paenibacillus sp. ACRRY TaxID=2918208 RepID=UPI0031BBB956